MVARFLLILLLFVLSACAVNVNDPVFLARNQQLIDGQIAAAAAEITAGRRQFYLGAGLWGGDAVFSENDVVDFYASLARHSEAPVIPFLASNKISGAPGDYPYAGLSTLKQQVMAIEAEAREDDLIFVLLSSHGRPNRIAWKVGANPHGYWSAGTVRDVFAPLNGHQVVFFIQACYAGSLIDDLKRAERIILTAAASDRVSFGCSPSDHHSYFTDALLAALAGPPDNLADIFRFAADQIEQREAELELPHSQPQSFVGADMKAIYHARILKAAGE